MNIISKDLLEVIDRLSVEETLELTQMFKVRIKPSFITADDCKVILTKLKPNDFNRPYYRSHERW